MPTFNIKKIEKHRQLSSKIQELPRTKTVIRKRKFKEERFTAGTIYTTKTKQLFKVKDLFKASMKKVIRKVFHSINRATSMMSSADCSCPAGKSGYCNHVMALLLELADYSLRGLKKVPQEEAWGIPGDNGESPVTKNCQKHKRCQLPSKKKQTKKQHPL